MDEILGWSVPIPANVRRGKYYDFNHVQFFVEENWGPNTPTKAHRWVMNNQDKVLEKLNKLKTNYDGTGKRIVGHPISKNVFFDNINPKIIKPMTVMRKRVCA